MVASDLLNSEIPWIVSTNEIIKRLTFSCYNAPFRMKAKLHLVFSITMFLVCFCAQGQQNYWTKNAVQQRLQNSFLKVGDENALFVTHFGQRVDAITLLHHRPELLIAHHHHVQDAVVLVAEVVLAQHA